MAYIGRGTENISNVEVLDNLTFNGSASYTLQKSSTNFVPSSANNLLISISGVVQQGNFSVSGSTITFDTTVSASDTCDWILHYGTGLITTVADGAITEAKLGSNAVTTAKINNGAITSAKLDSGLALGKIGQVVQTTKTDTTSWNTMSFVGIGLDVNITPSSSSSKILIASSVSIGNNGATAHFRFYRNSTEIFIADSASNRARDTFSISIGNTYWQTLQTPIYLDSPATTSQITYSVKMASNGTTYLNRSEGDRDNYAYDPRTASNIIVMEVLA